MKHKFSETAPGPIMLFGSGETSPSGRKAFDTLMRHLPVSPRVALLETPAGFELNSSQVIGRIADFINLRLQGYRPRTTIVPARKRGTPFSPEDPGVVAPLLTADMIFMGPGSPSYAVRELHDSLAWLILTARHRRGAAIVLASAATVAISRKALPVYEIYKVGEDIHWIDGLDFLGPYGLRMAFIPHWNNQDGGEELDTSRCFMGRARFEPLLQMLPDDVTVVGIDEKTMLKVDLTKRKCRVLGLGSVTCLCGGNSTVYPTNHEFSLEQFGEIRSPDPEEGLPEQVWKQVLQAERQKDQESQPLEENGIPTAEVMDLVAERQSARLDKEWLKADQLRAQIAELGWQVMDTPDGPHIEKMPLKERK
jgi:hypothetical protein